MFHVEHLLMLSPLRPTAQRGLSPLRPTAQRGGVEFAAQPGRRSAHAVHGDRNRASAFKHQGACCGCYRGLTLTLPIRGAQSQYWRPTAGRVGGDAGGGRVPQRRAREVRRMIYARSAGRTSITSSWHRAARDPRRLSDGRVHWRATFTATRATLKMVPRGTSVQWPPTVVSLHAVSAHVCRSGRPNSTTLWEFL